MTYSGYRFLAISILSMFFVGFFGPINAMGGSSIAGGPRGSSNASLNKMSYCELKNAYTEAIKKGNKESAIKYLDKMIPQCAQIQEAQELLISLANLYYELQEFSLAQKKYTEYAQLYPGSIDLEFALYRALLSCFALCRPHDRDQEKTEEALSLAQEFLQRDSTFTKYMPEVKKIEQDCKMRLLESELAIYDFYKNSGKLTSAAKRLSLIEENYGLLIPSTKMLELKIQLADAQKKPDLVDKLRKELLTQLPTNISNSPTLMAQSKNFTDRF